MVMLAISTGTIAPQLTAPVAGPATQLPHSPLRHSITSIPSASNNLPIAPISRKRSASGQAMAMHPLNLIPIPPFPQLRVPTDGLQAELGIDSSSQPAPKKGRTNTPWTKSEETQLREMRHLGKTWAEIAKCFPTRTEGSVKKHWYKDMHYAEFDIDESAALLAAIKEYEANKWKVIGQKLGKPAKLPPEKPSLRDIFGEAIEVVAAALRTYTLDVLR